MSNADLTANSATDALCVCGHLADEHHRSWFRNGGQLIEECEVYGFNETGGMEMVEGQWVEHCQRFRPALIDGDVATSSGSISSKLVVGSVPMGSET